MRVLILLVCCIATIGCTPPSRETADIQYLHDARTDLCFASRYGGYGADSYAMVEVKCSQAVRALAKEGH